MMGDTIPVLYIRPDGTAVKIELRRDLWESVKEVSV